MIGFLLSATLFAIGAPAAFQVQSADQQLDTLIVTVDQSYHDKAFSPTGWAYRSSLKQGQSERMSVTLTGGSRYQLIGVCETSCSNIDAHLYDASGKEVDRDIDSDAVPIVGAGSSGTYFLQIDMVACAKDACGFAAKAFRQ